MTRTWIVAVVLVAMMGALGACATSPGPRTYQGAAVGAATGAAAGVLLDEENRWRGGVIGGALGAILGGTLSEISQRAAREAATYNRPVYYQDTRGRRVEAHPMGRRGNCQVVKEKYYENGKLVKVVEREVCR